MPRLFLPNIAAGVIPKDVSYPSLDIQAVVPARVSISSRTRCEKADALSSIPYSSSFRHSPSCGNRSELSPFITIFMFCDAKIRRKNGTTKHSNHNLVKERLCYYPVFFCLFHRANHRLDELDFLVRQAVLRRKRRDWHLFRSIDFSKEDRMVEGDLFK